MDTYTAWENNKPIFDRLPGARGGYQLNDPALWITTPLDAFLVYQKNQVDQLLIKNLNPLICDEQFLDYLGFISGFTKNTWDRKWPIQAKRNLIINSPEIWNSPGSLATINLIINCFNIQNRVIQTSDFLIGISEVGDQIGDIFWDYTIFLPTRYQGTNTEKLVETLNYLFGVCYCFSRIEFDDSKFINVSLLTTEDNTALISTEVNQAFQVGD